MKEHFKKKFHVTEEGARGLVRAVWASFIVNVIAMFPVMILMLLGQQILEGTFHSQTLYFALSLGICVILFIALLVEYERMYNATYKESANLRENLGKTLAKLPLAFFSKRNLSDLAQSIMSDVEAIEHAMSHAIPKIYGLYLFIPILGVMLLIGNVKLGLAVILPMTLRLLILVAFKGEGIKSNKKFFDQLRANTEDFQEAIELHQEIRSYHLTDDVQKDLYTKMDESEKIQMKTEGLAIVVMALSNLFSFISLGIVLYVGVGLLAKGEVSLLYVVGYVLAAMKLKDLIDLSSETALEIRHITPRVENIASIQDAPLQKGKDVDLRRVSIDVEDVHFGYGEKNVLEGVNFTARQGDVTALVGPSGCGKSTLLKLMSRLYDYDSGAIRIGDYDIQNVSTDSLFKKTSIVFQDVMLFNTSVMENIRIGRLDATDEEVKEAARMANCMDFIDEMPEGFHTAIGENGQELSGGQRQRLSIARAFLKDAPILILDEITSSLDVENERIIQQSLNHLIQNKTVVIISHRLKSVEKADKIVVLNKGKVEGEGKHDELLKTSPTYRNLIEKSEMAEAFVY
ncbi:ABC transporter, ATP-binding protein [Aedoeadaptatus nemausensis]|uniref:ABC transporter, ATP-binding protein n=1 Tax=Aedoeadaptatus nemausensis TaxID=2582829 RepID=A0A6V6Y6T8_9FIRM|nr:ABC transporter ATP-binding protein [Peptoniphilus nemausensis]CAC9935504.1 ABC transporter, ATP-binding protein [Peptoniphilus nemausensis]